MSVDPSRMLRFEGRVAVITGAARGLGLAYAHLLSSRGATVVINDLGVEPDGSEPNESVAGNAAAEIAALGGHALADSSDISTQTGAQKLVSRTLREFGCIDILINNAGIIHRAPFAETSEADLWRTVGAHLGGHFNMTQAAWPHLMRRHHPRVVMTASTAALYGTTDNAAYAAAKGAIVGLTRALAFECAHTELRINAVLPGAHTRMAEAGMRNHDPELLEILRSRMPTEKVAPAVAWLSHERCSLNGALLNIRAGAICSTFFGQTRGVSTNDPSLEYVATHENAIVDRDNYAVPDNAAESNALMYR
jgi:NAD(P)-dependent dehydrogenase (short-subunit alcohol dehydrogenase family)